MKLLTEELRRIIPPWDTQSCESDPVAWVKLVSSRENEAWYVLEMEQGEGYTLCFGLVCRMEFERFTIEELEDATEPDGLRIERDLSFHPTRLSQLPNPYK